MQIKPQTIQIFLPDGSPTSIREAELTNRLVKAILFPRNKMQEVIKRDLVHFTGFYFLFGTGEDDAKPKVYIGEGEDCFKRIQSHNRSKDFWTHCVIISTKTDEYTKTDGKYLEHHCLLKALEIGRYEIDNDTGSKKPSISESREFDLLDNFETAKILLATLGYPIFEPKRTSKRTDLFYCSGKKAKATAEYTNEGFLVHQGSTCNVEVSKSSGSWVKRVRKKLIDQKIIKTENDVYKFQKDHLFNSPSGAAVAVLGRSANGWTVWKDKNGITLDELKRK